MISPVAKAFIFACKQARDRAALEAWMAEQKVRIAENLAPVEAECVVREARAHWRVLEGRR